MKNASLKPTLFLVSCLIAFPLALRAYLNYQDNIKEIEAEVDRQIASAAEQLATDSDAWIDLNLRVLRQHVAMEDMVSMNPKRQLPILQSIANEYSQWVVTVHIVNLQGENTVRSDGKPLLKLEDRAWFRDAMKSGLGIGVQIGRSSGQPTCAIALTIKDSESKTKGVLIASSSLTNVSKTVNDISFGAGGQTYILSGEGRVIAHPDEKFIQKAVDFSKHPIMVALRDGVKKKVVFVDEATNKKMVAHAQKTKYGWVAVAQKEYDAAYEGITKAKRVALGIACFAVLLILVVFRYLIHILKREQNKQTTVASFFVKTAVTLSVAATVPVGIQEYFNYQFNYKHYTNKWNHWAAAKSDTMTESLDDWIEMNVKMLKQSATLASIRSMKSDQQTPTLRLINDTYPWYWHITVYNSKGDRVSSSDPKGARQQNVSDRLYFQQVMSGASFSSEVIIGKTSGRASLVLAAPILADQKKVAGALVAIAYLANVSDVIIKTAAGEEGYIYLLTDNGKLVAHQKNAFNEALLDFSKRPPFVSLANEKKRQIAYHDMEKKKIAYSQKGKYGWSVVVEQEEGKIYAPVKASVSLSLTFIFCTLLSALALAGILTRVVWHAHSATNKQA